MTKNTTDLDRKQVAVSAFLVATGTITSRGLGFLRDMLVVHYFNRTSTDAFYVAFRIPNLFRRLFGEGALTVSFIPVLTDFLKSEDKKSAREFISSVFTLLFIVLSLLTILGTLFAQPIVTTLSSGEGFTSIPGKLELTVHQTRIMFCYIFLVSMYAFFMGILNTVRIFWLPAVAPALWNLSLIIGVLFFRNTFEISSDVLAWATIIGGFLQAAILIPSLRKNDFIPVFRKWWGSSAVNRVLKSMGPSVFGLSVMQITVLINTYFASNLEEGSNSWIYLADRILEFPLSIFAVSMGTAALPTLSKLWSKGDREGMSEASLHTLKLSLFMAIPCAAGIYVLAQPIVHTLFEHGKFSSHDSEMTSAIIRVYGIGVIFATGIRVLAPSFYAMKNTWAPALAAAMALVCHLFIAYFLTRMFGVVGLAASSVISMTINFLVLVILYQRIITSLGLARLFTTLFKILLASLALGFFAQSHVYFENLFSDDYGGRAISLVLVVLISASVYLGVAWLLNISELTETSQEFTSRIKRKLSKIKS